MRVLLLEDDLLLARKIAHRLRKGGVTVDSVEWLQDAARRAAEHDYDCLVLDRVVPGGDALELVGDLRAAGNPVPVMVVSAYRVSPGDQAEALRCGADDYLIKPFGLEELSSRVRSLCRRAAQVAGPVVLHIGDLTIDTGRWEARRGDQPLRLHPKDLAILAILVRKAGEVVPTKVLWEHCWEELDDPYSNIVDVHVSRLRRTLGEPRLIRTVRGIGYSLGTTQ